MKRAVLLSLLGSWAMLSFGSAALADALVDWPLTPGEPSWYRVSLQGRPAGYLYSTLRFVSVQDGGQLLEATQRLRLKVTVSGIPVTIEADTSTRYDRELRPLAIRAHINKLGVIAQSSCRWAGEALHMVTTEGSQRREQTIPVPADYGSDLPTLLAIARGEVKPGESRSVTIFDPQVGALDKLTITNVSSGEPRTFMVDGRPVAAKPVCERSENLGVGSLLWLTAEGEMVCLEMPELMEAVAEKVTEAEALAELTPLVLSNSIILDRELPASRTLQSLTLQAQATTQEVTDLIPTTARQRVEGSGLEARILLRAQPSPGQTLPLPLKREGFESDLQSTPLAPVDNPRLRDLAGQITAGQTDSYQAALAVSHWVYQNLQKVESHPSPINALQILDQMRGDCSEHALLAAALCRAAGIPARMVTGLAAQRNKVYYHAWLEVYVGEWVELDPTWKENLVDAGHLRLADSDLDPLSFMRMNLETGRTLGALRLQVLDFQTVGG